MALQRVVYFLVIDCSFSMESSWEEVKAALLRHLERVDKMQSGIAELRLEVSVSTFNQDFSLNPLAVDFNAAREVITNAIPSGQSAMYNALGESLSRIERDMQQDWEHNTVWMLCFYTDGQDNSSEEYALEQIKALLASIHVSESVLQRFHGYILGDVPEQVNGLFCLQLDENRKHFVEELGLSFDYLEEILKKLYKHAQIK